jgi:uncharacterized protein YdaU (DUF1376 family)
MRPDEYIKLTKDFFQAVHGKPAYVKAGYLSALCYYRFHNHCQGLENDSEFLRKVCDITPAEWREGFNIIFDNEFFFTLDVDGLWQQKRAKEDYEEDRGKYWKAVARGLNASKARRFKHKMQKVRLNGN